MAMDGQGEEEEAHFEEEKRIHCTWNHLARCLDVATQSGTAAYTQQCQIKLITQVLLLTFVAALREDSPDRAFVCFSSTTSDPALPLSYLMQLSIGVEMLPHVVQSSMTTTIGLRCVHCENKATKKE